MGIPTTWESPTITAGGRSTRVCVNIGIKTNGPLVDVTGESTPATTPAAPTA